MLMAHLASVAGYVAATLLVQGLSHFRFNAAHYRASGFFREKPVVALGVLAMLVQGLLLSLAFQALGADASLRDALLVAWSFGAFLASYMGLALAGEMSVPNVSSWIRIELSAAAVQFTLAGLALWAAHRFL